MSQATKRVTELTAKIKSLNKKDISSMLLFTLYKMTNVSDTLTLSELPYMLSDEESLMKLLTYYGGMTITFPKVRDFRLAVQAMTLYQFVNLEHGSFDEGIKIVTQDKEFSPTEIKEYYTKLIEVMNNYDFG